MNIDLHKFMFEWGPALTASILLIYGFFYAWICCVGTPVQKTIAYLIFLVLMIISVLACVFLENIPGEKMLRGQMVQEVLLGILVPMLAGIGLFAWCNPEKWVAIAESRKYAKGFGRG